MRGKQTFLGLLVDYKKSSKTVKLYLNNQQTIVGRIIDVKKDCIGIVNDKEPGYGNVIPIGAISCLKLRS